MPKSDFLNYILILKDNARFEKGFDGVLLRIESGQSVQMEFSAHRESFEVSKPAEIAERSPIGMRVCVPIVNAWDGTRDPYMDTRIGKQCPNTARERGLRVLIEHIGFDDVVPDGGNSTETAFDRSDRIHRCDSSPDSDCR